MSEAQAEYTNHLQVEHIDTAAEFLRALVPAGDGWHENVPQAWTGLHPAPAWWVFRGQADAGWQLVASAHRGDRLVEFLRLPGINQALVKWSSRRLRELVAVYCFIEECRRSGVAVPEDGQVLRALERKIARSLDSGSEWIAPDESQEFPPEPLLSSFAIAQHHEVPTRLLDWSGAPFVSAYFAAESAVVEMSRSQRLPARDVRAQSRLAVWALLRSDAETWAADAWTTQSALGGVDLPATFRFIEAPLDSNDRLRAQAGLFTAVHTKMVVAAFPRPLTDAVQEDIAPLEKVIGYAHRLATEKMGQAVDRPWLRKITLPWAEAPQLLRLLSRMNIHAGTVYLGHSGAVRSMRERASFSRWPGDD